MRNLAGKVPLNSIFGVIIVNIKSFRERRVVTVSAPTNHVVNPTESGIEGARGCGERTEVFCWLTFFQAESLQLASNNLRRNHFYLIDCRELNCSDFGGTAGRFLVPCLAGFLLHFTGQIIVN
ncbi:hypothetical protein AAHA92_11001 [Salvia divinorum]|uniref:Uncharacterized protein n=1 Tax=Salvia divinorum TaxID=28513 RepID=A0ABD1I0K1_SALDI